MTITESLISLFKVVPEEALTHNHKMKYLYQYVQCGFVVVDTNGQVVPAIPQDLAEVIASECGFDIQAMNQTFHKNFGIVQVMDELNFYSQQFLHYFSTYGLESLGLKAQNYIPTEKLDCPEIEDMQKIVIIRAATEEQIEGLLKEFLITVAAPSKKQVEAVKALLDKYSMTCEIDDVISNELQIVLYDYYKVLPTDAMKILRYLVYKTTGETLIIKNKELINKIKMNSNVNGKYNQAAWKILRKADLSNLSTIFFRFKPIWLAYKVYDGCAYYINKMRRLAEKYHKPVPEERVANITKLVKSGKYDEAIKIVDRATTKELVKIHGAITKQICCPGYAAYNIRNGKLYVPLGLDGKINKLSDLSNILSYIEECLINRLTKKFKGKTYVMPSYIDYPVPVSAKQFTGNLPWGTAFHIPETHSLTTGIYWENTMVNGKETRVDLDYHLASKSKNFGWNNNYISGSEVIYSGDVTNAPIGKGAAEAFYIHGYDEPLIATVSKYYAGTNVSYKFYVSTDKISAFKDYTFNPNKVLFPPVKLEFDVNQSQMNLGIFTTGTFIVYGGSMGQGRVPSKAYSQYIDSILANMVCMLSLRGLLLKCGAQVKESVEEVEEDVEYIDLSPEALTSTTLLDIV